MFFTRAAVRHRGPAASSSRPSIKAPNITSVSAKQSEHEAAHAQNFPCFHNNNENARSFSVRCRAAPISDAAMTVSLARTAALKEAGTSAKAWRGRSRAEGNRLGHVGTLCSLGSASSPSPACEPRPNPTSTNQPHAESS